MDKFTWASQQAMNQLKCFQDQGKIDSRWKFAWNRRKKSLGLCEYSTKTIYLSVYYVEHGTVEDISDTILHEIAHIIAGHEAGHGPRWKAVCREIGARPIRCGKSVEGIPSKYQATCPLCSTVYKVNRALKQMDKRMCGKKTCSARRVKAYLSWSANV